MADLGRPHRPERASESRLDALREEARRTGGVLGASGPVAGGPIPLGGRDGARPVALGGGNGRPPGYYGRPIVKPPVWTWEIPLYFFVGGLAGMASVLALAATLADVDAALEDTGGMAGLIRAARWLAAAGAAVSPILLTLDLGRPTRFLNMLRVFKARSPMSVGAWLLVAFGGAAWTAALVPWAVDRWGTGPLPVAAWEAIVLAATAAAALFGALLATYTGVLIGATAIPAWFAHRRGLPFHFGIAGLGSAAAALELLGFPAPPLHALGLGAAAAETAFGAWIELRRHGAVDRAVRQGPAGLMLRGAGLLAGPLALVLRLVGLVPWAAASFLAGALLGRYGWLAAGRASGRDPEATLAAGRTFSR
jgi:hypothetical protein